MQCAFCGRTPAMVLSGMSMCERCQGVYGLFMVVMAAIVALLIAAACLAAR